jgi:hypothetical protein
MQDVSAIWQAGSYRYKETNPQNLTNVSGAERTYPDREPCEEKSRLSRIERQDRHYLG